MWQSKLIVHLHDQVVVLGKRNRKQALIHVGVFAEELGHFPLLHPSHLIQQGRQHLSWNRAQVRETYRIDPVLHS